MTSRLPTPDDVAVLARLNGVALSADAAQRIAGAIGPAVEAFAAGEGDVAFETEPALFVRAQHEARR